VGEWQVDGLTGEIVRHGKWERLEPRTMAMLLLFARHPGAVLTRDEILEQIWPKLVVGEDALARALFKLRKALGDDAKSPAYIETLPKRGYRLIATVQTISVPLGAVDYSTERTAIAAALDSTATASPVQAWNWRWFALASVLLVGLTLMLLLVRRESNIATVNATAEPEEQRAQDFYGAYSRAENEAAVALYERILAGDSERVAALAGLASALTQRVLRWPQAQGRTLHFTDLTSALKAGHLRTPYAREVLARARLLAQHAVQIEPENALARRSLGLVVSAQGELDAALVQYDAAIAVDADAWGALINRGEVLSLLGRPADSVDSWMAAFAVMTRRYQQDRMQIQPWYAELAVLIGQRLEGLDRSVESESWYRRALAHTPLHAAATVAQASLLQRSGQLSEARRLCLELNERIGAGAGCEQILAAQATKDAPAGNERP